ncbi:MAG: rhomboid family intramembrane serine protease [Ferruginibacter sp.]
MGESDRYQEYRHYRPKQTIFRLGSENNALMALFVLNGIFFLLMLSLQVSYFFGKNTYAQYHAEVLGWFTAPADPAGLLQKPWTVLTYMFTDSGNGLMRIISNMVWMWVFGSLLQKQSGNDRLFPAYIYGGLVTLLLCWIGNRVFSGSPVELIGATGAVLALATTTVFEDPTFRVLTHIRKGIPIWVLYVIYVVIVLLSVASAHTAMGFSLMGGAGMGWLYAFLYHRGYDIGAWMSRGYSRLMNLFTPASSQKKKSYRDTLFYQTFDRPPYQKQNSQQQRIDEILDKINEKGFEALTDSEKEILRRASDDNNA